MTQRKLNGIKAIGFGIIVLTAILLGWLSIANYSSRRIVGSWNLDFDNTYLYSDSDSLEFLNGWTIIHNDGCIDLPPLYVPNRQIQSTLNLSKGRWSIDKENDSIIISAPNHPFNGKYFMRELRVKKGGRSLELLQLSNDSNAIVLFR